MRVVTGWLPFVVPQSKGTFSSSSLLCDIPLATIEGVPSLYPLHPLKSPVVVLLIHPLWLLPPKQVPASATDTRVGEVSSSGNRS